MLSLAIAGLTSCNNDDREENMSSLKKSVLISSNRDNPFDTVGIKHNVWLYKVLLEREGFEKKMVYLFLVIKINYSIFIITIF